MIECKPLKIFTNNVECACGWSSGIAKLEDLNFLYVKHLKIDPEPKNLDDYSLKREKVGVSP